LDSNGSGMRCSAAVGVGLCASPAEPPRWEDFVILVTKALKHDFDLRMGTFRIEFKIRILSDAFIRNALFQVE